MGKKVRNIILLLAIFLAVFALGFYRQERNQLEATDSFYGKLAHGFDVNILIVGDSISAGSGASDDNHRWPVMLENYLEETYGVHVLVNNVSLGGNTSYAGYVRTRNLQDGDIYDLTILCFAQNDSPSDLAFYYEALVRAVQEKCPNSSILSIKESTLRKEKHIPKAEAIESVSAYYEIPVADMVKAYQASTLSYEELSEDLIHPSDPGQQVYFETICGLIEKGVQEGWKKPGNNSDGMQGEAESVSGDLQGESDISGTVSAEKESDSVITEKEPMNPSVWTLDSYEYLEAGSFYQKQPLCYETDIMNFEGIVGFDYIYGTGEHWVKLKTDGVDYLTLDLNERGQTSQRYIWVIDEAGSINGNLEIEFSDEEAAGAFQGLILSREQE